MATGTAIQLSPADLEAKKQLDEEFLRNELLIGAGIVATGAALGALWGLWSNYQYKQKNMMANPEATKTLWRSVFEFALIGLVLALIAAIAYRVYFQSKRAKVLALQQKAVGRSLAQRYRVTKNSNPSLSSSQVKVKTK